MNGRLSRHLKRVISAAIVLMFVTGATPVQKLSEFTDMSITASAVTVGSVSWEYDPDTKVLTFSGTGAVNLNNNRYYYYNGRNLAETVIFEDGITSISGVGGSKMKSITIPDSVTVIGENAFSNCKGLTSIDIPDSVTEIDSNAFSDCTGLTSVHLPEHITEIKSGVFLNCTNLTSVSIPNGVTKISDYDEYAYYVDGSFAGCSSLKSIEIPDSVTVIGSNAFLGCTGLTSIEIPNAVTEIGDYAFSNCTNLTSIFIPDSVTEIGSNAFSDCTGLTSVDIPDSVTEIGSNAFSDCTGLTSVHLPENITEIKSGVFLNCTNLTSVSIPNGVTKISDYDEYAYDVDGSFAGCSSLKSIEIPDSVTVIGCNAFSNCTGLTSVIIPEGVTAIGNGAFKNCTGLTSVDIPKSVTELSGFEGCTGLISVSIPEGVTVIGGFEGCTGLTEVTIPKTVTEIQSDAFYGCTNLKSVIFESNGEGEEDLLFGYSAFGSLTEDVSIEIPRKSRGGLSRFYSTYIDPDYEYEYGDSSCKRYFGDAKVSIKSNGVTYTKVEAEEATCTTDGNSEYYIGSDGKYYWDDLGYYDIDDESDVTVTAYGHNEKVAWSWTKLSSGDYTAVAKFSCTRGDLETEYVKATVTADETDEGTTYHAVAVCPLEEGMMWHTSGHEVTYDYFVESTKYSVTVEGGSLTDSTKKDSYKSGDSVTVKADKEKDDKFFTGWYIGDKCVSTNPTYTFFVKEDTTITAKYEKQETEQAAVHSLTLTRAESTYYWSYQKIKYVNAWSLPEGSTLVEAGILRAYDTDISEVTPDTAKSNGVTQNKSSLKTVNGTYTLTVNMSYSTKLKTVYAKGYVIYTDAKGVKHTQITDMQTSAYES